MAQSLVEIKADYSKIARLQKQLAHIPNGINKVVVRALNKVAAKAKTEIVRKVASESGAKQKAVRAAINVVKASYQKWSATIQIKNKRVPLIKFGARQTNQGVRYKIPGGEMGFLKSAFIQVMPKTGHRGVFSRKTKRRLPMREHYGSGIGSIYEQAPNVASKIISEVYRNLNSQIDTQVKVLLNQVKK